MPEPTITTPILGGGLPLAVVLALCVAAVVARVFLQRLRRRGGGRWLSLVMFVVKAALTGAAIALACEAIGRGLDLAPRWQLTLLALAGAFGIEAVIALYALERSTVGRAGGGAATALRAVLVLLILAMLAQPTFSRQSTHADERFVAVLVDESASMTIDDRAASARHRLAWSQALGVASTVAAASPDADPEAAWNALSPESRKAVEHLLAQPRSAQAIRLLEGAPGSANALLARIKAQHTPRVFRFDADASELVADASPERASAPAMRTDLAAALARVRQTIPASRLAGIVVLSDGRHNAATDPAAVAAQLADDGVPVSAIVIGEERGLPDAALVALDAPDVVILGDELVVGADILVRELAGKDVKVTLSDGEDESKILAEQTFKAEQAELTRRVELRHRPQRLGLTAYGVRVEPIEGETVAANNAARLHTSVTDQPAAMLLIDDRPRWEFRYLRTLFADRDRSVKLQHLLLNPDWIEGAPERTRTPASAARPREESEATALPLDFAAWSAFDLIVLGDVGPDQLGPEHAESLRRYVEERGGRLVVVAGVNHMPHAWDRPAMRELLPVVFEPTAGTDAGGPLGAVRIELTPAGREHPVTRLEIDAEANRLAWQAAPPMLWYHAVTRVKPGATVLAQAALASPPVADAEADAPAPRLEPPPLIVEHRVGKGSVLMLLFDSTWRLRYRQGDTYHHRFWGQVVRWATADRMPLGNDRVRFGVERTVYAQDEPVVARARLRDRGMQPIAGAELVAVVTSEGRPVRRAALTASAGSAGDYEARIGVLPPGRYDVALEFTGGVEGSMRPEPAQVTASIAVDADDRREMLEAGADRAALERIASATGGVAVGGGEWERVLKSLGPGTRTLVAQQRYELWHGWPLLAAIAVVAAAEWVLRKRMGLP